LPSDVFAAARDALKKPGETPSLFAYLKLPIGRPPKKASSTENTSTEANNPTEDSVSYKPPPLPQSKPRPSRGSYQSFDREEYAAAKAVVLEHLVINGDVAAAIKAVDKSHPMIVVKRQTANSWLKKVQKEAVVKTNNDDSDKKLASFDRHVKTEPNYKS
jgi:hypothetical protein